MESTAFKSRAGEPARPVLEVVFGSGTGVGKTYACAWRALVSLEGDLAGLSPGPTGLFKPAETFDPGKEEPDSQNYGYLLNRWRQHPGWSQLEQRILKERLVPEDRVSVLPALFQIPIPLSPHLAYEIFYRREKGPVAGPDEFVEKSGRAISRFFKAGGHRLILETAGGIMVEWLRGLDHLKFISGLEKELRADTEGVPDLITETTLVSHCCLGTINDTLLSWEKLVRAGRPPGRILFSARRGCDQEGALSNLREIELRLDTLVADGLGAGRPVPFPRLELLPELSPGEAT